MDDDDDLFWNLIAGTLTLTSALVVKKLLVSVWAKRRGGVPGSPGDGRTTWGEAALFAVASGALVGLARLVANRAVAAVRPEPSASS